MANKISNVGSAKKLALKDADSSFFSNVDPNTGMPILNQSIIDSELKRHPHELNVDNSEIRNLITNAGWNTKSDGARVLNGAAIFGLKPRMRSPMGGDVIGGSTDAELIATAKQLGIDPNKFLTHIPAIQTGMVQRPASDKLNQDALYNAIDNQTKNLYSVTNATTGFRNRGDAVRHATVLYKSDGKGNLVAVNNQQTGQPIVNYSNQVSYHKAGNILSELAPFIGIAGLAFGLPAIMGAIGEAGVGAATLAGAGEAAGLTASEIGAMTGAEALGLTSGAGLATGTMEGTMLGAGVTGAGLAPVLGTTAEIAGGLSAAGLSGAGSSLANVAGAGEAAGNAAAGEVAGETAGLPASQVTAAGGAAPGAAQGSTIADALNTGAIISGVGSGLNAIGSIYGANKQADAAKKAAEQQQAQFDKTNAQFAPYRGAGYESLNQIRSMLPGQYTKYDETGKAIGTATGSDYLTHQFNPQDLQAGLAPNYQFMLNQGQQQNQRLANVGGGSISGNTLRGLEDYTQNYAQNAYQSAFNNYQGQRQNIYNTLAGIAGIGQNATNSTAQAGANNAIAQSQLGVGSAAANAAGVTGAANAISTGAQNYANNQVLQQILAQNQNVAQRPAQG